LKELKIFFLSSSLRKECLELTVLPAKNTAGRGNKVMLGRKHSKETKEKMSRIKIGELNPMYGRKASEETRKKMSLSLIGKYYGEMCCFAKLNELQVRIIKRLLEDGTISQVRIGQFFGVSGKYVSDIKNGKSWKYVHQEGA